MPPGSTARARCNRLGALLLALLVASSGLVSHAAAQAGDVAGWAGAARAALPSPPDDYETRTIGSVRWAYPEGAEPEFESLSEVVPDAWTELEDDLGVDVDDELEIRIARDPEEMRALAPRGLPPPGYAAGVAYTAHGLILLTFTAPDTWERPDLETVLVHELSHIVLRRAVNGHPLPRWFVEGVAIQQSGERSLERTKTLWQGHFSDTLIPLSQLDQSFPRNPHEVSLAYAQAADVIRFLRRDAKDERKFRTFIGELAEGESFAEALSDAYAITEGVLERDWRTSVGERARALPLIAGGGTFWVIAAMLLIAAWRRRRRQAKKKLAAMAAREQEEEEALAGLEALAEARLRDLARADGEGFVVYLSANPGPREPDIPTVDYDGDRHTLH